MSGEGAGGATSFEDMSHEQMLAWLDQANAGTVQAAAARLTAAAKEIRKIAEELKVRPQYVEWKGEGADAFRTWTGDLANATLRLGDFGEDSATWLGHASDAIAQAQVSIPRDKAGAQANLDAATAAHNDPDAATVSHKSTTELAALAADKEKVRQEAAAQMTKLGQAYRLSATQLDGLERPRFPPPPKVIQPAPGKVSGDEVVSSGGNGARTFLDEAAANVSPPSGSRRVTAESIGGGGADNVGTQSRETAQRPLPDAPDRVSMKVDGTEVLPRTASAPPASPLGPPNGGRGDSGGVLPTEPIPPMARGVSNPPVNPRGRAAPRSAVVLRLNPGADQEAPYPGVLQDSVVRKSQRAGQACPGRWSVVDLWCSPSEESRAQLPGVCRAAATASSADARCRRPLVLRRGGRAAGCPATPPSAVRRTARPGVVVRPVRGRFLVQAQVQDEPVSDRA